MSKKHRSAAAVLLVCLCLLEACSGHIPVSPGDTDCTAPAESDAAETEPSLPEMQPSPSPLASETAPSDTALPPSPPLSVGEEAERLLADAVFTDTADDGTLCFDLYDTYAAVTGFCDSFSASAQNPVSLVIAAEYENLPVRVIAADAFSAGCGVFLESVSLPEGLWRIGERAFLDQHYLRAAILPDSILSVGEMAFVCQDPGEEHTPVLTLNGTVLSLGQKEFLHKKRFDISQ